MANPILWMNVVGESLQKPIELHIEPVVGAQVGQPGPNLDEAVSVNVFETEIVSLRGKWTLLHVANYADLGDREFCKALERWRRLPRQARFQVIGLHVPRRGQSMSSLDQDLERLKSRLTACGIGYAVLADPTHRVVDMHRIPNLPVAMLIDPQGIVRYLHRTQLSSPDTLAAQLSEILSIDLALAA
jgi:hypothetical protein